MDSLIVYKTCHRPWRWAQSSFQNIGLLTQPTAQEHCHEPFVSLNRLTHLSSNKTKLLATSTALFLSPSSTHIIPTVPNIQMLPLKLDQTAYIGEHWCTAKFQGVTCSISCQFWKYIGYASHWTNTPKTLMSLHKQLEWRVITLWLLIIVFFLYMLPSNKLLVTSVCIIHCPFNDDTIIIITNSLQSCSWHSIRSASWHNHWTWDIFSTL